MTSDGIGRGCCFSVALPTEPQDSVEMHAEVSSKTNRPPSPQPFRRFKSAVRHAKKKIQQSRSLSSNTVRDASDTLEKVDMKMKIECIENEDSVRDFHETDFQRTRSEPPILLFQNRNSISKLETASLKIHPISEKYLNKHATMSDSFGEGKGNDVHMIEDSHIPLLRNRILIVDDSPMNRKMMKRILEIRFDSLAEAENGQQALDMVRASLEQGEDARYDVITMDYQMPVMDGVTATRRIRQLGYTGQIIGVTGNALAEDVNTFLSSGADVVLTKPLTIAAFDEYLQGIHARSAKP